MMSDWQTLPLEDICDNVQYGVTVSASSSAGTGPKLLRITDIVPPQINWNEVPRCDLPPEKIKKFELEPGDIVVARTGATVGYAKQIMEPPQPAVFASYLVRFQVSSEVDSTFVGQIVQSSAFKQWVATHAGGAAQPNANAKLLGGFPIPLPAIGIQQRVAAILMSFDELIEINERRIKLLEDLARSLHREWFVHFRFPGHEGVGLVDSELGLIPEDWSVQRIKDVTSSLTRGVTPKYDDDGRWTVLNQRCIRHQRVSFSSARRHEGSVADKKQLRLGDVLINSTGVGTLGRVAVLLAEPDSATVDSHVTIARPASLDLQPWFGLHMFGRESAFQAMGTGSTGQTELGCAAVGELPTVVPSPEVLAAFGDVTWSLLRPIPVLSTFRDWLVQARDLLLWRLVSGQLDIADIDLGVLAPAETE